MRLARVSSLLWRPVKLARRDVRHLDADRHLPLYQFNSVNEVQASAGCTLVGVEITDDAVRYRAFAILAGGLCVLR